MSEDSVTIIGAGIVGICCALSLQERGIHVRLVDRGEPGQETSFGNAGVISPWSVIPQAMPGIWKNIPRMLLSRTGPLTVHPTFWPKMVPWGLRFLRQSSEAKAREISDAMDLLCRPSVDLYRRHLQGTGHEGLVVDSFYVHAFRHADRPTLDSLDYKMRREKGAELEVIGAEALRAMEPALSHDFRAAVVIKGQARAVSPGKIGQVLAEKAIMRGAEFIKAEVTGLSRSANGGWEIRTTNEILQAERIVLAAGVWSAVLLRPLGLSVPLAAERGYHVEFPKAGVTLKNSVMDVDAKIVASSMADGVRVAGSSEFADADAPADPRKKALLTQQARAMLPDLDPGEVNFWMGRRPSFPDSLPSIGPIPAQHGLFSAFGHSHYGLMMAPKTGEMVADLLANRTSNVSLEAFMADRF